MFTLITEHLTNPLDVLVNQSAASEVFSEPEGGDGHYYHASSPDRM